MRFARVMAGVIVVGIASTVGVNLVFSAIEALLGEKWGIALAAVVFVALAAMIARIATRQG